MRRRGKTLVRLTSRFPFVRLGSSAVEHNARANDYLQNARRAAGDVVRAVRKGACGQALHELIVMNRQFSAALQERRGAGWNRKFPNAVTRQVDNAEDAFKQSCLVTGRAERPSGPPRLRLVAGARR